MASPERRLQFRSDREQGHRLELCARNRGISVSELIRQFIERGLAQDGATELHRLERICGSLAEDADALNVQIEGLAGRESGRFRYLLGHLQQLQAMVTELLLVQRVRITSEHPADYARALDLARRQVSEDAAEYRASLAAGSGTSTQPVPSTGSDRAA